MQNSIVRQEDDFGKDLGLVHEMVVTGRKVGADKRFYAALTHGRDLFQRMVDMVNAELNFTAPRPTFPITVNYGLNVYAMLAAAQTKQDYHRFFEYDFPVHKVGGGVEDHEIEIFRFYEDISGHDMIERLDELGYRPANFAELLALLAQHHEEVDKILWADGSSNTLIALGTLDKGDSSSVCPGVSGRVSDKCFGLTCIIITGRLSHIYRIAAVKK